MTTQSFHGGSPTMSGAAEIARSEAGQLRRLWDCALHAWSAYWSACLEARGVNDLCVANAILLAEEATLASQAAQAQQRFHGRVSPSLNES